MQVIKVTEARKNFFQLMDRVKDCHEPVMVIGKHHNVVMLSEEDWRSIEDTIYLSSMPKMADSIKAGMQEPISEGSETLPW